jgi:hypothetical protein
MSAGAVVPKRPRADVPKTVLGTTDYGEIARRGLLIAEQSQDLLIQQLEQLKAMRLALERAVQLANEPAPSPPTASEGA